MKAKKSNTIGPSKKEIRNKIEESVNKVIGELHLESPSRKVRRVVKKSSKQVARKVRQDLKAAKAKEPKKKKKKSKGEPLLPIV